MTRSTPNEIELQCVITPEDKMIVEVFESPEGYHEPPVYQFDVFDGKNYASVMLSEDQMVAFYQWLEAKLDLI